MLRLVFKGILTVGTMSWSSLRIRLYLVVLFMMTTSVLAVSQKSDFYGSFESIPAHIQSSMVGFTYHKGCPMPLKALSYLTVTYWGFDHKPHHGHLIILNELAGETLDIFHSLYKIHFPIERMKLPYKYKATDDWPSTENNNTVGFFCRQDQQSVNKYSPHSYGIAIDLNPLYNPSQVSGKRQDKSIKIQPEQGKRFFSQRTGHQGMINKDSAMVRIFAQHGWKWGGYWHSPETDYMHFQKDMDSHYQAHSLQLTVR